MKIISKILVILFFSLFLASCLSKDPATQCLESFRSNFKDPESGRVIDFKNNILTYTATNSYGARTQGKALCEKSKLEAGNWTRDKFGETIMILNLATERMEKNINCRKTGKTQLECAEGSRALGKSTLSQIELEDEIAQELGYK